MGNFYTNYTLRGPSQQAVAEALAGRRAVVTPSRNECVVAFDQASDEQDVRTIPAGELGQSGHLDMFRSEYMNEVLCRWESADIRRRDGSLLVWDLRWPGLFARHRRARRQAVAACRQELLSTFLRGDGPIFLVHEPPQDYEIPGAWQPASAWTWLVPPDFNLDHPAVAYWLFVVGNWSFYRAAAPAAGNWPDAFRCRSAELVAWMKAQSVQALIESFHDDTAWVVALGTGEPTAEADGGRLVGVRESQGC